ncbi:MAG: HEAT repeat domain-containing protein [Planctomycetota bacterium]
MINRIAAVTTFSFLLCFCSPLASAADTTLPSESDLISLLTSDVAKGEKAIACKQLAVVGSDACVETLTPLLRDPELASWARIALQAIPGEAADQALIGALSDEIDDRTRVGIANTLGLRGTSSAVEALANALSSENETLAESAAVSLGHIGGEKATVALAESLKKSSSATVRNGAAEGLILIAERAMESGEGTAAAEVYDMVGGADVAKPRVIAALRGSILSRGADGVAMLVNELQRDDWKRQGIALMAARELVGEGANDALVKSVDDVSGQTQALYVTAISERDDPSAAEMLISKATAGDKVVRVAAIEGLARIGDATALPDLLTLAASDDSVIVGTVLKTLASIDDDSLDGAIAKQLDSSSGAEKVVLLKVAAARRVNAIDAIRQAAESSDDAIRAAAFQALGQVATMNEIPELIEQAVGAENEAAMDALKATCIRMPDRDAVAGMLMDAADKSSLAEKQELLSIMTLMGGQKALAAMREAAISGDRELQDLSTRFLGSWMTVDAAPVLIEIAKKKDHPYRIRALRGHLRIARQFLMNRGQRLRMAKDALAVADRDAERMLILDVVKRYPHSSMLDVAVQVSKTPSMRPEAIKVATELVRVLGGSTATLRQYAKIWSSPPAIEILEASYGADGAVKDVTSTLKSMEQIGPAIVIPESFNATFGDPVPGVKKQLKIRYKVEGSESESTFAEGQPVIFETT